MLSISEICKRFSSGKNITSDNIFPIGKFPVYGGNGLRGFTNIFNFDGECSIIGRQGAYCGNVRYFQGKGYMSDHAIVAVVNDEHDNKYFAYKLSLLNLNRFSGQAAQPGLSVTKLSRLKLEMPSLAVQRRIAEVLSAYDALIENNNKRIRLLERMAENLYREWFVRFRFPGHETIPIVDGLPQGWKIENLVDVANLTYGYAFKSDLFCENRNLNAVVRIRDIQDNYTQTYTEEECSSKFIINENSILIGMDGIFHMCLWCGQRAYLNQRVVMIESKLQDFCNYLLYFNLYPQIKFWEQTISGTTVAHLGDKHLKKIRFLIPSNEILQKANCFFKSIMEEKTKLLRNIRILTRQRDALLPRLMSGKLEVTTENV